MNREDAVKLAAELVEKMGNNPELNNRGYKVDGWKPFTGPERADAIVKLAEVLIDPPDQPVPPERVFGWVADGYSLPPTDAQFKVALAKAAAIRSGKTEVPPREADAIALLIQTYQDAHPAPEV